MGSVASYHCSLGLCSKTALLVLFRCLYEGGVYYPRG